MLTLGKRAWIFCKGRSTLLAQSCTADKVHTVHTAISTKIRDIDAYKEHIIHNRFVELSVTVGQKSLT